MSRLKNLRIIVVGLLVGFFALTSFVGKESSAVAEPSEYNNEIATKLVTRCDLIKDYLSKTGRINELAARQNKVRGWEYVIRRLDGLAESYDRFNVDHSELASSISSLRQQLEQFKVDFEAYDGEFRRLLSTNCKTNPQDFWRQLETLRSFRAGVALSAENYKNSLNSVIIKEDAKW